MAKKKTVVENPMLNESVATMQPITETLEKNYMPYAMSVIISRAIPEIDGFKPSHRKLLYTMYEMGLLNKQRTKSANIVGQTMLVAQRHYCFCNIHVYLMQQVHVAHGITPFLLPGFYA